MPPLHFELCVEFRRRCIECDSFTQCFECFSTSLLFGEKYCNLYLYINLSAVVTVFITDYDFYIQNNELVKYDMLV